MTSRRDEIQKSVDAIVTEARVPLDARLLSKDIVELTLQVTNNLLEPVLHHQLRLGEKYEDTYANSLSMLSPKPGVSTIVRAMRTPSSSNSVVSSAQQAGMKKPSAYQR